MNTQELVRGDRTVGLPVGERERLVREHLPQVRFMACSIHDRLPDASLETLINAGIVGLFSAIDGFDPTRRVMFSEYARHRIKGAILDNLRGLESHQRSKPQMERKIPISLWQHALDTFGSASSATDWFWSECGALDNRAPIDAMGDEGGNREIDRILGCLDYGMIA